MKKLLLVVLFISNIGSIQSQTLDKKYLPVVSNFIASIKSSSIEKLSKKISYPLNRTYPIPPIKNKQEFVKRYKEVFDDDLVKKIIRSKPSSDWDDVGWRGIMLLNGELWLDTDGKLIAVNHQSKLEAKEQTRLINIEKSKLHPSLANFIQPVSIFETAQYRVRIDDLGNRNYRYASWPLKSKMSDKPSIVLSNGRYDPDGSGGSGNFNFKSGIFLYTCFISARGENDALGHLIIKKNDKEILSQQVKKLIP
jgi:hypothetical protein